MITFFKVFDEWFFRQFFLEDVVLLCVAAIQVFVSAHALPAHYKFATRQNWTGNQRSFMSCCGQNCRIMEIWERWSHKMIPTNLARIFNFDDCWFWISLPFYRPKKEMLI